MNLNNIICERNLTDYELNKYANIIDNKMWKDIINYKLYKPNPDIFVKRYFKYFDNEVRTHLLRKLNVLYKI